MAETSSNSPSPSLEVESLLPSPPKPSGYAFQGHLFNPTFSGPDWLTGGSAGPEGSWPCIALLVILGIICSFWLRPNQYPNPDAIRFPLGEHSDRASAVPFPGRTS